MKYPICADICQITFSVKRTQPFSSFLTFLILSQLQPGSFLRLATSESDDLRPQHQSEYFNSLLGINDPYSIPKIQDNYSSLFWWDYKDNYLEGTTDAYDEWKNDKYPYIGWAADNFHGKKRNPISNRLYPLTWEQEASQAKYENLKIIDDVYVTEKISTPHTWHTAEVFLYLIDN